MIQALKRWQYKRKLTEFLNEPYKRYSLQGMRQWLALYKDFPVNENHDACRGIMLITRTLDITQLLEELDRYRLWLERNPERFVPMLTLDSALTEKSMYQYFCAGRVLLNRTDAHRTLCVLLEEIFRHLPNEDEYTFRAGAVLWQDLKQYIDCIVYRT